MILSKKGFKNIVRIAEMLVTNFLHDVFSPFKKHIFIFEYLFAKALTFDSSIMLFGKEWKHFEVVQSRLKVSIWCKPEKG